MPARPATIRSNRRSSSCVARRHLVPPIAGRPARPRGRRVWSATKPAAAMVSLGLDRSSAGVGRWVPIAERCRRGTSVRRPEVPRTDARQERLFRLRRCGCGRAGVDGATVRDDRRIAGPRAGHLDGLSAEPYGASAWNVSPWASRRQCRPERRPPSTVRCVCTCRRRSCSSSDSPNCVIWDAAACALSMSCCSTAAVRRCSRRRFLTLVRGAELPRPETQRRIRSDGRHVARVDFLYADLAIVVEVSGRLGHSNPMDRGRGMPSAATNSRTSVTPCTSTPGATSTDARRCTSRTHCASASARRQSAP